MSKQNTAIVYIPSGIDSSERWEAVEYALRQIGITDIRPAPMPSLSFQPRHRRTSHAAGTAAARRELQSIAGWRGEAR